MIVLVKPAVPGAESRIVIAPTIAAACDAILSEPNPSAGLGNPCPICEHWARVVPLDHDWTQCHSLCPDRSPSPAELVANDICPKCGGDLDTGWECNDCDFDARPIAYPSPTPADA